MAETCGFTDKNAEIKSQLIQKKRDSKVRKKALRTTMTLTDVLSEARNNELTRAQNVEIEKSLVPTPSQKQFVNSVSAQKTKQKFSHQSKNMKCYNCGGPYPHTNGPDSCPARGTTCGKCSFHTRKKVEKELKRLVDADIYEKADGHPTTWVSPIVVVPKKSTDDVRICVDMKVANQAIIRERHPTPTVDDIADHLNGCTVFSKIDLRQGYLQLELDEESRHITTFATHLGLYRSKKLSFGITSSSEIFQKAVEEATAGIKQVLNISDDLIVGGKGQQDHDKGLVKVLMALLENGFTINLPKCLFSVPELHFYGMKFSKDGMQPDALMKMAPPPSVPEVLSLLGMLNYSSRFIPSYSRRWSNTTAQQ
ncbi:uncharacterized protein K02A2.6-like [Lineus longissimus]|uniref:uncharacterized protein K02A2.6-like n=1 Tax=Lineus longissimus TaxID=88925 RepID=UPI00315C94E1